MKRHIAFHEIAFETALKAEARAPHEPTLMQSGNSRGPIKMWICTRHRCNEIRYTYDLEPPVCLGGAKWSFTTQTPFDPSIHAEKARFG